MMTTTANMQATSPISVKEINFDGDSMNVIGIDGRWFAALKPICDALGLDWGSQYRNLKDDIVLNSTYVVATIVAKDKKQRDMVCLPFEYLNGWLFKINPSRYKGHLQEKIIRYQKECYRVLHDHFFPRDQKVLPARTTPPPLKEEAAYMRTQLNYRKTISGMRKQAEKEAERIYKGNGTLEDLDLCPDIQAMTRAVLEELNKEDLFKSSGAGDGQRAASTGNQAKKTV